MTRTELSVASGPTTPVSPRQRTPDPGEKTDRKAVYSPCKLCEKPSQAPIWQVKAFDVTHDQMARDMVYKDAFLEFYEFP